MASPTSVPELILQIFEHLPLVDLISAYHVDSQWRALVPRITSQDRLRLFNLTFQKPAESPPVSLADRLSYVNDRESKHDILIPEPYRTVLTEWPIPHPPPGMHWPHAVRFYANGFCSCQRSLYEDPTVCHCGDNEIDTVKIYLPVTLLDEIIEHKRVVDKHSEIDARWELFHSPPRLHTEQQNAQTVRLILAHQPDLFPWPSDDHGSKSWRYKEFRVLPLSRYANYNSTGAVADGHFMMILDGPTRGQIHGWQSFGSSWYDGFEAETFWEWKYDEWVPLEPLSPDSDEEPVMSE